MNTDSPISPEAVSDTPPVAPERRLLWPRVLLALTMIALLFPQIAGLVAQLSYLSSNTTMPEEAVYRFQWSADEYTTWRSSAMFSAAVKLALFGFALVAYLVLPSFQMSRLLVYDRLGRPRIDTASATFSAVVVCFIMRIYMWPHNVAEAGVIGAIFSALIPTYFLAAIQLSTAHSRPMRILLIGYFLLLTCLRNDMYGIGLRLFSNSLESNTSNFNSEAVDVIANIARNHDFPLNRIVPSATDTGRYIHGFLMDAIVLNEGMLTDPDHTVVVGVFAHELAHRNHGEVGVLNAASMISSVLDTTLPFLLEHPVFAPLLASFGLPRGNHPFAMSLVASQYILGAIYTASRVATDAMMRAAEFSADRFASEQGFGSGMASFLRRYHGTTPNIFAHPRTDTLCFDHPSNLARVEALDSYTAHQSSDAHDSDTFAIDEAALDQCALKNLTCSGRFRLR